LERRDRQKQRMDRKKKIGTLRPLYNKWYKKIKKKGVPKYLKKGWAEKKWKRLIRHRQETILERDYIRRTTRKKMKDM